MNIAPEYREECALVVKEFFTELDALLRRTFFVANAGVVCAQTRCGNCVLSQGTVCAMSVIGTVARDMRANDYSMIKEH